MRTSLLNLNIFSTMAHEINLLQWSAHNRAINILKKSEREVMSVKSIVLVSFCMVNPSAVLQLSSDSSIIFFF